MKGSREKREKRRSGSGSCFTPELQNGVSQGESQRIPGHYPALELEKFLIGGAGHQVGTVPQAGQKACTLPWLRSSCRLGTLTETRQRPMPAAVIKKRILTSEKPGAKRGGSLSQELPVHVPGLLIPAQEIVTREGTEGNSSMEDFLPILDSSFQGIAVMAKEKRGGRFDLPFPEKSFDDQECRKGILSASRAHLFLSVLRKRSRHGGKRGEKNKNAKESSHASMLGLFPGNLKPVLAQEQELPGLPSFTHPEKQKVDAAA